MTPIVQEHLEELKALCRKYHVAVLYLFGSAANGEFKEESSDIDFLVTFESMSTHEVEWQIVLNDLPVLVHEVNRLLSREDHQGKSS